MVVAKGYWRFCLLVLSRSHCLFLGATFRRYSFSPLLVVRRLLSAPGKFRLDIDGRLLQQRSRRAHDDQILAQRTRSLRPDSGAFTLELQRPRRRPWAGGRSPARYWASKARSAASTVCPRPTIPSSTLGPRS